MRSALQRTPDRAHRFYAPDYRRQLRDAGAFRALSPSEQVVLAALCDRANASGIAWPAVETIATQYGLGESTVREAIKRLTTRGLVLVVRQAGRTNTYRLTLPTSMGQPAGDPPPERQTCPSRKAPLPLQNLAPIMTNDHPNDHDQQHHARARALEAAASLASPATGEETPALSAPEASQNDRATDAPIDLLSPELVEQVRTLGLAPAKLNRYGADRVRWVLERLETERARKVIGNPAGWVVQVLKDTWSDPLPVLQQRLPFARAAAEASRPPAGVRWGKNKATGKVLEVEDMNDDRVRFAGGFNALVVPAHLWGDWEWLAEHPHEESRPQAGDVELPTEPDPTRQTALAIIAAWMAIGTRTSDQLEAKLTARGLTRDEWEAYQGARALETHQDGER